MQTTSVLKALTKNVKSLDNDNHGPDEGGEGKGRAHRPVKIYYCTQTKPRRVDRGRRARLQRFPLSAPRNLGLHAVFDPRARRNKYVPHIYTNYSVLYNQF